MRQEQIKGIFFKDFLLPGNIGVGEVVRLTEADETVIDCENRDGRFCRIFPASRLKTALDDAASAFFAVLDNYSLEDMIKPASEMKKLLRLTPL